MVSSIHITTSFYTGKFLTVTQLSVRVCHRNRLNIKEKNAENMEFIHTRVNLMHLGTQVDCIAELVLLLVGNKLCTLCSFKT